MIVITTPTSQIGRQVLGNLRDSGEQLRASARTSISSRARMATRRWWTRHLPAPMPFFG